MHSAKVNGLLLSQQEHPRLADIGSSSGHLAAIEPEPPSVQSKGKVPTIDPLFLENKRSGSRTLLKRNRRDAVDVDVVVVGKLDRSARFVRVA